MADEVAIELHPGKRPSALRPADESRVNTSWFEEVRVEAEEWLIERLVPRRSYTGIFGRRGAAKSFLALDMANCGALGLPFLGEPCEAFGSLYCVGEKKSRFGKRIEAWRLSRGIKRAPVMFRWGVPNLLSGAEVGDFIAELHRLRPGFAARGVPLGAVFLDTLSRSLKGANVSDPDATGIALNAIQRIVDEASVTVLTLAHMAKAEGAMSQKGAGEWEDAADALIRIERKEGEALRTVTLAKQSDEADGLAYGFELEVVDVGETPKGQRITSCVIRQVDLPETRDKRDKLAPDLKLIMQAFNACMDAGQTEPVSLVPGVPPGRAGVRRDALKTRVQAMGYADADEKPETVRRSLNRDLKKLLGLGRLREHAGLIWAP